MLPLLGLNASTMDDVYVHEHTTARCRAIDDVAMALLLFLLLILLRLSVCEIDASLILSFLSNCTSPLSKLIAVPRVVADPSS